ncbi:MAG: hypothetical protein A2Y79_02785 [Deltaproteobacteria bacterium RBG_13_43_22]|nr:MAG: hypothetical protein A2Y79_02785 [Deltaproteobacteria bacterium RBG_13_43_22]
MEKTKGAGLCLTYIQDFLSIHDQQTTISTFINSSRNSSAVHDTMPGPLIFYLQWSALPPLPEGAFKSQTEFLSFNQASSKNQFNTNIPLYIYYF